jgi:CBS domain containing-hemolysin-like protein
MDGIPILLIAILLSAFFSGMKIALVTSNRLRIELDRKQGVFGYEIIKLFTGYPGQYIATMLIGNTIALVIYGLVFSSLIGPELSKFFSSDILVLLFNTLISATIILFVAEILPKTVFPHFTKLFSEIS